MQGFTDPAVAAVFAAYPAAARRQLLALRALIFRTAAATPGVGALEETLKWGEPAYLTPHSKSGSSLRIGWRAARPEQVALYFNCQTDLVERFRTGFAGELRFEGRRAVLFETSARLPRAAAGFCIAAALTYHRRGSAAAGAAGIRTAA